VLPGSSLGTDKITMWLRNVENIPEVSFKVSRSLFHPIEVEDTGLAVPSEAVYVGQVAVPVGEEIRLSVFADGGVEMSSFRVKINLRHTEGVKVDFPPSLQKTTDGWGAKGTVRFDPTGSSFYSKEKTPRLPNFLGDIIVEDDENRAVFNANIPELVGFSRIKSLEFAKKLGSSGASEILAADLFSPAKPEHWDFGIGLLIKSADGRTGFLPPTFGYLTQEGCPFQLGQDGAFHAESNDRLQKFAPFESGRYQITVGPAPGAWARRGLLVDSRECLSPDTLAVSLNVLRAFQIQTNDGHRQSAGRCSRKPPL